MKKHWFTVLMSMLAVVVLVGVPLGEARAQMAHDGPVMDHSAMAWEREAGNELERVFLSMMIPHHLGAVEMSRFILPLAQDPQVIAWAEAIMTTQQEEMVQMEAWLSERGGVDQVAWQMMEQEMAGMMDLLRQSDDPERAFVEYMIPHHLGAVEMALPILEQTRDVALLALVRDIITAQAEEITQFRLWLLEREDH